MLDWVLAFSGLKCSTGGTCTLAIKADVRSDFHGKQRGHIYTSGAFGPGGI